MYTILIDQHRTIWDDTDQSTIPQHILDAEAAMREAGGTPERVAVTAWPVNYRRGRVLSANNARCDDPADTHPPRLARDRKDQVVRWALDNTKLGFALRAIRDISDQRNVGVPDDARHEGRPPYPSAIYLAFVKSTLAAAHADANLLNAAVWEALDHNTTYKAKDITGLSVSNWKDRYERMEGYRVFLKAGTTFAVGPTEITLAAAVDADAIEWVEGTLFDRRR